MGVNVKAEHLLLGILGLWLWSKWQQETSVSLPSGSSLPMQGDPHEVPPLLTELDPHGFPALFNAALQVLERAIDLGPSHSPAPPPPDPEYDLAARVFAMQAALETDNGRAMYHYNTGNVTTESGAYFLNPPQDTKHKYAVFLYPLQGALEQVRRVKRLWPAAYRAAFSGSVTGFASGLKPDQGLQYFDTSAETYRKGMLARGKLFGWNDGVAGADAWN